nr:unnamed protein product [Callosobruchus analis]
MLRYCLNRSLSVTGIKAEEGYECLQLNMCRIFCCYSSPNITIEEFRLEVDNIMTDSMDAAAESTILGDLNVKSPQWGSLVTDRRGEY